MDSNAHAYSPEKAEIRSQLYSFLGNSLLKVMTADTAIGLDPRFWEALPLADAYGTANEHIEQGIAELRRAALELQDLNGDEALERVGVEYTRLFIGPGTPAAPPWETLYREGGTVLFGQPTIDMRRLFGEQGYRTSAESHQFEDHIGFELLYLAMRYASLAEAEPDPIGGALSEQATGEELRGFILGHPLSFIGALYEKASASCAEKPGSPGYYPALIKLAWGLLLQDAATLPGHPRP